LFGLLKKGFDANDTESIIRACINENKRAQEILVASYINYIRTVCRLYTTNVMEVDEMVNDSFIKIFGNLHRFDHSRPFKSWMRAIVINCCIDYYRKHKTVQLTIPVEDAFDVAIDHNVIDQIAADELLALVHQLSHTYRLVFTLYVVEGYNHREIAALLGIQEGTSKSNLRDARIKLQKMMVNKYGQNHHSSYQIKSI
jgi:RNA polymerase sigma-70 factor, ECF subfamily